MAPDRGGNEQRRAWEEEVVSKAKGFDSHTTRRMPCKRGIEL